MIWNISDKQDHIILKLEYNIRWMWYTKCYNIKSEIWYIAKVTDKIWNIIWEKWYTKFCNIKYKIIYDGNDRWTIIISNLEII